MRFIIRLLGLWLLATAVVLLVVDGTRSLGANALLYTPIRDTWVSLHPDSLSAFTRDMRPILEPFALGFLPEAVLSWPGWAIFGGLGVALLLLGQTRSERRYIEAN